jgi:hypothetical protein
VAIIVVLFLAPLALLLVALLAICVMAIYGLSHVVLDIGRGLSARAKVGTVVHPLAVPRGHWRHVRSQLVHH